MKSKLTGVAFCMFAVIACSQAADRVVVAAGTTLVDSGLIDSLAARYEIENPGVELSIIAEPTALALELGEQGAADMLLVHAPDLEAAFVDGGFAATSRPVVISRFVLIGPPRLAGEFAGMTGPEAFAAVARRDICFVSRADGSGTNETELKIWGLANVDPTGMACYIETGQGMGPTIQVADQRNALTLAEYGAFSAAADSLELVDFELEPEGLANPYTGHVAARGANAAGATKFLEWLTSSNGVAAILEQNQALFGEVIYQPASS